jgi:hypothetical protein
MRDSEGRRLDERPVQTERRDWDVIVLGATEYGLTAAIAAARQGSAVLVVSDSDRIGGISGWATNLTDFYPSRTHAVVGGLAREVYEFIAGRESTSGDLMRFHALDGPTRPTWYLRAWAHLLRGLPITVRYNASLESVTKQGTRIVSGQIGGTVYTARVWVDATTTGDVARLAGCTIKIGREADGTYAGETGVGVLAPVALPGGGSPVDPYVTPGVSGSGLLFGVDSSAPGTVGSADGRVMTCGWRLFLTTIAADKRPWPTSPPAGYDASKYELMARMFASAPTYWNDQPTALNNLFHVYGLGNNGGTGTFADPYKVIDLNSNGFVSSNYPNTAETLEYVTASRARRLQIEANATSWVKGLFYWLLQSGDSRIPANLIAWINKYGLSNKELGGSDGWSPQLYIREGARLVGDSVFAKGQLAVNNGVTDWIGWVTYDHDAHPVRVIDVGGSARYEGTYNVTAPITEYGAPIPVGVLYPRVAEVTNLVCPGAPSVSRYVWTAIRVIPTLMQLGEAAGIVASIAAREGNTVQTTDPGRVQAIQNLKGTTGAVTVAPDGSAAGPSGSYSETGAGSAWSQSTVRAPYIGSYARTSPAANARPRTCTPSIPRSGRYRVLWMYPPTSSADSGIVRATNVAVTITHADGSTNRVVNQQYNTSGGAPTSGDGGYGDDLGEFFFVRGTSGSVTIDPTTANGLVADGGFKFVPVSAPGKV